MNIEDLTLAVSNAETRLEYVKERRVISETHLKTLKTKIKNFKQVRRIVTSAASVTQEKFKERLSRIVTDALTLVYPNEELTFDLQFVEQRNNVEVVLSFKDFRGNCIHPLNASGHGLADLSSVILRASYILLNKSDPVALIDEPFKNLQKNLLPLVVSIMRRISEEFGFQWIIVTHEPEILNALDPAVDGIFKVVKKGSGHAGVSTVKSLGAS